MELGEPLSPCVLTYADIDAMNEILAGEGCQPPTGCTCTSRSAPRTKTGQPGRLSSITPRQRRGAPLPYYDAAETWGVAAQPPPSCRPKALGNCRVPAAICVPRSSSSGCRGQDRPWWNRSLRKPLVDRGHQRSLPEVPPLAGRLYRQNEQQSWASGHPRIDRICWERSGHPRRLEEIISYIRSSLMYLWRSGQALVLHRQDA